MLPDLFRPGLSILIYGTAAGEKSAALGQYYAHPSNRFWKTLAEVGLTPTQMSPADFRSLPEYGIGLTDVEKRRAGSDDVAIGKDSTPDGLLRVIAEVRPRVVAFNGKRAAEIALGRRRVEFGLQAEKLAGAAVFVLPSTSGAARGVWDLRPWQDLARLIGG